MATYAIGDLQGCYEPFCRLLDEIGFQPEQDCLWLVGDLVNRGPQSLEVLRLVKSLGDSAVVVLGNHDLHLIMQAQGYGRANREDTLTDVLSAPDSDELLAWLRLQPLFHHRNGISMVHAGLLPSWSVFDAQALSGEVSAALTGPHFQEFLASMWGSQPDVWSDDLEGWDRLRVVVNAMTRMRFCSLDGRMDFRSKGPPQSAPPGSLPWFQIPNRRSADTTIVCGHWSALGFRQESNLLALDSGCLWGGALTAVRLEDRAVFQIPCPVQCQPSGWD